MSAMQLMLILGGITLVACGGRGGEDQGEASRAGDGMAGMQMDSGRMDRHMSMESMSMMPMMREHMDSMMRLSPDRMARMMAAHERMMSQMMDRMGGDMRSMTMAGSAEWNALTDSVKSDLAELPTLQGAELSARMKAHGGRVRRLLAMHESMMKGM